MKQRKHLARAAVSHALNLIVASGFIMGSSAPIQAAEKKTYTKPPFAAFSSQMDDALLGSDKYEKPVWNLHDALKLPEWLSVSVEQRTRYETMDGTFKAGSKGGDQQIPLQTTLWLEAHMSSFRFGTEFMDARGLNSDSGTGMNNTMSDSWDFLQAYGAWADQNVAYSGLGAEVVAGRQTINLGSRRLVARNAFRNTINSFTGIKLRVIDYGNWQFNGFVTAPVNRLPTSSTALLDNEQVFDRENTNTWFSGGFLELYDLGWGINNEFICIILTRATALLALQPAIAAILRPARAFSSNPPRRQLTFNWKPSASSARYRRPPLPIARISIIPPGISMSMSATPLICRGRPGWRLNMTTPAATKTPTTKKTSALIPCTAPAVSTSAPPAFTAHSPAPTLTRPAYVSTLRRAPMCKLRLAIAHSGWQRQKIAGAAPPVPVTVLFFRTKPAVAAIISANNWIYRRVGISTAA